LSPRAAFRSPYERERSVVGAGRARDKSTTNLQRGLKVAGAARSYGVLKNRKRKLFVEESSAEKDMALYFFVLSWTVRNIS